MSGFTDEQVTKYVYSQIIYDLYEMIQRTDLKTLME